MRWRRLLRLVLCVGWLAPTGCSSTRVECDCATGNVQISSGMPVAQMVTTGAACPTQPFCGHPLNGGQCDQFEILFTAAGTCHIVATAADGRQATVDETVTLSTVSSCCGNIYRGSDAQLFLFPPTEVFFLLPDRTGWVDRTATGSTNIQGRWYGFADGFGADGTPASGVCELAGHAPAECSQLTSPSPGSFPNLSGKMCTTGVAAQIADIVGGTTPDYNAISSAGIAFSFNVPEVTATTQLPYDAVANGVAGIGFDIDTVPSSGLRIQFPTVEQSVNPPFWGGLEMTSPVVPGHNEVLWKDVMGPFYDPAAPAFDPTMVLRLEFLVPSSVFAATPFSFCVSNLIAIPK